MNQQHSRTSPAWKPVAVVAGAVVAVGVVLYAADWFTSTGDIPRGVTVAGVDVGGRSPQDAEALLRDRLGSRADQPVPVRADDATAEIVPAAAGLGIDWAGTFDRAGDQPLSPITRLTSFFGSREIGVVSSVDDAALTAAVENLRPVVDRAPVEGGVVFDAATPVPVLPVTGRTLDVDAAASTLERDWATGDTVDLPYDEQAVTVTEQGVRDAVDEVATPAVSAPVVVTGRENAVTELPPERVGEVLRFEPNDDGGLDPIYDTDAAIRILAPGLAETETRPVNARFDFSSGRPVVVPSQEGVAVQWPQTLENLPDLLAGTGPARSVDAQYGPQAPAVTTEQANGLGIREVVAEYTTGGFEYASGVNIGLTADIVNGAVVAPGETFSLNGYTGPRGTAQGFVESGIIDNGRPDRAVGGGISQFATTLYNASYFAGMEDVEHTEHSYYISRYPEAREATVFEGAIDLKFRNPFETGAVIESFADSSSVTVRIWGTKTVDVESITGSRSAPTSPDTIRLPRGPQCIASSGAPGFTTSDTRVVTDAATGAELSRTTRTVKYDPVPIVRCE
ncbi:Vancomycin resistance protein YoaR, contains peptidoglycan-binding and VanW domains [Rhodococcoides kroppenstedtii]|uniref:Vancomycin resistance protein YoaR, contains peptidoglycan-binding and VanW domains n=1 Tax=Rhodococcoides kroppenstedtii TaxID=293050 RepID=A0A1I0T5I0_9NOCA|nr:Vancomycin resistance protein YoaR, contains peptidoglycan-binding and VanW domains [Rhodococcus kroppenstedtii]